jgi:hypothetical protein
MTWKLTITQLFPCAECDERIRVINQALARGLRWDYALQEANKCAQEMSSESSAPPSLRTGE